ncbi:MAG: hypothetical protein ACI8RD_014236, partial [Bacillariaceae sp.]
RRRIKRRTPKSAKELIMILASKRISIVPTPRNSHCQVGRHLQRQNAGSRGRFVEIVLSLLLLSLLVSCRLNSSLMCVVCDSE